MRLLIGLLLVVFLCSCSDDKTMKNKAEKRQPVKIEKKKVVKRPTVGTGKITQPAIGPKPAYNYGNGNKGYILVKNWDFGKNGTIKNMKEMSKNFQYHDQFKTIGNGTHYGALMVAANEESSLKGRIKGYKQPIDKKDTNGKPIREFFQKSLKTYLIPLRGAKECYPKKHNVGSGSFQAKWTLPKGGKLLGMDMIWETRVRYEPPPYFWFAIWTAGNKWSKGAEMDLIESFGWDNGNGNTNYDGQKWHSSVVGGKMETNYHKNWGKGMKKYGISNFDASKYHIWTWVYRADDTYTSYMDGKVVQNGTLHWTLKGTPDGMPLDMSFIYDAGWGHTKVKSVNKPLPASAFEGKFYEWDYSRVYLRKAKKISETKAVIGNR